MKKLLALVLALVMVMGLFAACGNNADNDADKKDDKTTNSTPEESSTEESEPEVTVDPNVRVLIAYVVDEDGNPMEGVLAQFCDENGCTPVMTDEEGKVSCYALTEKTVKMMEMPEGYEYATTQEEWDFTEGDEVTIVLKLAEIEPSEEITEPEEVIEEDIPEEVIE